MRKAVIDLGTNTFNLLIAEVHATSFDKLFATKDGVALGMGGIHQQRISEDAWERAMTTLKYYHGICKDWGVEQITAIGTSALRDAQNKDQFIAEVFDEIGVLIEIVSGLREAELIYNGVRWSYDFKDAGMIMDIGGGSTEFIFADEKGVKDMISLNFGVSRIYQQMKLEDPFTHENVLEIESFLEKESNGFFDDKNEKVLIGASGSFETFYEMHHLSDFPSKKEVMTMPFDEFLKIIDSVIFSSFEERNQHPFIIPIRKKMAPIAAVKIKWIIRKLGIEKLIISPCSLKEGVLYV